MPFWKGWHLSKDQIWDNLADWQKEAGMDKHSIIAEPLFVDAANHDFQPAKGSPAIEFVKPRMPGANTKCTGSPPPGGRAQGQEAHPLHGRAVPIRTGEEINANRV